MNERRPLSGRQFNVLLYPDDPLYVERIDMLNSRYRWVAATHDKDIDSDGNIKKCHVHVVARLPSSNATSLKSFADRLQLPYDEVRSDSGELLEIVGCKAEVCRNYRRSLRYLLHVDDPDKYQYSVDVLFGHPEMISEVQRFSVNTSIDSKIVELMDLLDSIHCYISEEEFIRLVAGKGLWSAVKTLPSWLIQPVLIRHNEKYNGFSKEQIY